LEWNGPETEKREDGETTMDVWKGKTLVDRNALSDVELHYRIYNAKTGELMSFSSNGGPGSLNGCVQDAINVMRDNPGIRIYVEQFDGPVYER
jgi:hypothetical protein